MTFIAAKIAADLREASPPGQQRQREVLVSRWYRNGALYVNKATGKRYRPHTEAEKRFVVSDRPRRALVRGGEGSGKSVAGIIKDLERLRRGMSGIMGSPDFVHFRKSLWKEFQRWCPQNALVPKHRYRLDLDWQPNQPFELVFEDVGWGQGTLLCGGFDNAGSWEGPNVNFGHFDEARHHPRPTMAKVLDGRCRIAGPRGEPSQWWITTTPRKSPMPGGPEDMEFHWLFEMFGPHLREGDDLYADFKHESSDTVLLQRDNAANLDEDYVERRRESLTEKEARILADAEWESDDDVARFLDTIMWWDACDEPLPEPDPREPMIIALDAATGRKTSVSDNFGMVALTPHPQRVKGQQKRVAIRYVNRWQARAGQKIDFLGTDADPGPEKRLHQLIASNNIKCIVYDPYQLHDMMMRIEREKKVWVDEFSQAGPRLMADKQLLDLIVGKRMAFNSQMANADILRRHIDNADRKVDEDGSKFRLVKGRGHIDLAVCTSMGATTVLELNI